MLLPFDIENNPHMKSKIAFAPLTVLLFLTSFFLTSCEAVEGIFKAGAYSMLFFIILIVAVIIFIVAKLRNRN